MRKTFLKLVTAAAVLTPGAAFAGWGAISCDAQGSGACSASAGWPDLGSAESEALSACQSAGYTCFIYAWEHNTCVYGPGGSYACN